MAVDIIITLTSVGADQGTLFNLYSNVDGFNIPYEEDVLLTSLQSGYTTSAPDNTTTVRVCGESIKCINCVDITPTYTTTTTTTLPPVECGEIAQSGGPGITEFSIPLETVGGILVLDFEAFGVVDKLEILHSDIKVATSGMTVPNAGPFDDLYGDPVIPTEPQAALVDQFIGSTKGPIPNRQTDLFTETGLTYYSTKQQLVWWVYDASDVITNANAIIRVTGPTGTAWNFTRLCDEGTTTSTTTIEPTTTTTTTTEEVITTTTTTTEEITTTTTTTLEPTTTTTTTTGILAGACYNLVIPNTELNDGSNELFIRWTDMSDVVHTDEWTTFDQYAGDNYLLTSICSKTSPTYWFNNIQVATVGDLYLIDVNACDVGVPCNYELGGANTVAYSLVDGSTACGLTPATTVYWGVTISFSATTGVWTDPNLGSPAAAGYYAYLGEWRQWDGVDTWLSSGSC